MKQGKYRKYPTPAQCLVARGKKFCGRCKRTRKVKFFAIRKTTTCGYSSWCKECNRKYEKENQERFRSTRIERYYLRVYGIIYQEFKNLIKKQRGKCFICKKKLREPHLDHNHKTKKVRKVLCHKCNVGLGHFNDNPKLLRKAAKYLEKN